MKSNKAFTLIELLVVVLIIGILAAIAVPQYQKAVEKSRMTEAIILVRKIAEMHQAYYMATGKYLGNSEIDKLDITIPGGKTSEGRVFTEYFVYSPNACTNTCSGDAPWLAFAKKIIDKNDLAGNNFAYQLYITKTDPQKIECYIFPNASSAQQYLCEQLNTQGHL